MSVCTAGYKGEAPKGLVREGTERDGYYREMGTTERWVLQREGYYRERGTTEGGEAPKGLSTGRLQRGDDV